MDDYNNIDVQVRCKSCLEWVELCKCIQYGLEEELTAEEIQQRKEDMNYELIEETYFD